MRINKTTLAALLFLTLAAGCSKKNDDDNPNGGKFQFRANGKLYTSNKVVTAVEQISLGDTTLFVAGFIDADSTFVIGTVNSYQGPGTYNLNQENTLLTFDINDISYTMGTYDVPESHGTLQVTGQVIKNGIKRAKGTFSGVAYTSDGANSLVITDGVFQDSSY